MNKKIVLLVFSILSLGYGIWDNKYHDAGLLLLRITNFGRFGYENAGVWPKGTNHNYIFGSGIWVGGLKDIKGLKTRLKENLSPFSETIPVTSTAEFDSAGVIRIGKEMIYYRNKKEDAFLECIRGFAGTKPASHRKGREVKGVKCCVTVGYNPSDVSTEFVPGELPNEPGYTDPADRIYMSDNPEDTTVWPLKDKKGNKVIVSNQDSYCIFNDLDEKRHKEPGEPLGIKIVQIGYSWYYKPYEDFIFLTYLIINVSEDTLRYTYIAVCCDPDVGEYQDDLVGFDKERNLGYAYDSDFSVGGWDTPPGYIGFDFLESPVNEEGKQLGLTSFKIIRNPGVPGVVEPDPDNDNDAYQLIAGYNYTTGEYHPFDSISEPTDVRFLQCTGPFDLAPYDTARVVIAVIAGADLMDLQHNSDVAQELYDSKFVTHKIWLLNPRKKEEIAGYYKIKWRDVSVTGNPLKADVLLSTDAGESWDTLATGIEDRNFYLWNSTKHPDGTRCLIRVTIYDEVAIGEAISDTFTINNPGNGLPYVKILSPQSGEVSGVTEIKWKAEDPDRDPLKIDIFYSKDKEKWENIAEGIENTGCYFWDTRMVHNGRYYLMIRASDQDTCWEDTTKSLIEVKNEHSVFKIEHVKGRCNTLSILGIEYDPSLYTGHEYEISFEKLSASSGNNPVYHYVVKDLTLSRVVYKDSLCPKPDGSLYIQRTPIIDGFALEFNLQIDSRTFRFIEFSIKENKSGFDGKLQITGEDEWGTAPPIANYKWAFRGSNFEIRWVKKENGLTLKIYDLTNQVEIPYDTLNGDNWHFGLKRSDISEFFDPEIHKAFYLGGGVFWFNKEEEMTIPPGEGDVWIVKSSGHVPPSPGNQYRFETPGKLEKEREVSHLVLQRSFLKIPNPGNKITRVVLYDVLGRKIREWRIKEDLVKLPMKDSQGRRVHAGVYFIVIESQKSREVKKVLVMP